MNEKTKIRLNKLAPNDKGVNGSFRWIGFLCLFAVFIPSDFGSTGVPSLSSNYLLTTRFYSTESKKARLVKAPVVRGSSREIKKLDPN